MQSINRNIEIKELLDRAIGALLLARHPMRRKISCAADFTFHYFISAILNFMIDASINNHELSSPMKCDR